LSDSQTNVWENFTAMEQNFLEPLKETLKETTLQYQAELMRKKDEMAENKSMCRPYWMLRINSILATDSCVTSGLSMNLKKYYCFNLANL